VCRREFSTATRG